jgi:hypothetical protein
MVNRKICLPVTSFFLIALGGLLLHLRIHPPGKDPANAVPIVFGIVSTFVLPFLFNRADAVLWAYGFNVVAVIAGTLGMIHYSVESWQGPLTLKTLVLQSTLPDILILWARLPLAHLIWRQWIPAAACPSGTDRPDRAKDIPQDK